MGPEFKCTEAKSCARQSKLRGKEEPWGEVSGGSCAGGAGGDWAGCAPAPGAQGDTYVTHRALTLATKGDTYVTHPALTLATK
eukprot:1185791-Prorocentrum_minimum.AAC.1